MTDILHFFVIQLAAISILFSTAVIAAYQYFRYCRIRKLYRADYAKAYFLNSVTKLLPFMPDSRSRRYRKSEALIIDSGFKNSVEGFYIVKAVLFVFGFVFFTCIQTTNAFILYESILNDMNIEKTLIDKAIEPNTQQLLLEKEMFDYSYDCLPKDKTKLRDLLKKQDSQAYIEYLEVRIRERYKALEENAGTAARRMYKKLISIRSLENDYSGYACSLVMAILLYFLPNMICHIKLKLIEDKRDWELLNYTYVFSIFGRMPPYSVRNVLSNIMVVSDIYRPVINEALNGAKSGRGEEIFDSILQRIENQELYELLETMRLAFGTGLLNIVENIDDMAANQLKWLEIKSIKRRKSKQIIAMLPVVLIMLIAAVYFSYSLSMLSNPMNFMK